MVYPSRKGEIRLPTFVMLIALDLSAVLKVPTTVRTYGQSQTEVWSVTDRQARKALIRRLPAGEVADRG